MHILVFLIFLSCTQKNQDYRIRGKVRIENKNENKDKEKEKKSSVQQWATLELAENSNVDLGYLYQNQVSEITFDNIYKGNSPIEIVSTSGLDVNLTYKGGEYPGTGGNCKIKIEDDCRLVFEFNSAGGVSNSSHEIKLNYQNGKELGAISRFVSAKERFLLGQEDFDTNVALKFGFSNPVGLWSDGSKLFVSDYSNSRVLLWNTFPTTSAVAPDLAIGTYSVMTRRQYRIFNNTLSGPTDVFTDGNILIVTDELNNRVLIWNKIPTENDQAADVVLGQLDFESNAVDDGNVTASTLHNPISAKIFENKLYVADGSNHRVLIWNTIPTTNGQPADRVLGQINFSSETSGGDETGMNRPRDILVLNSKSLSKKALDKGLMNLIA